MIAKRYGKNVESVEADFNPVAMNEIGFRRDREWKMEVEQFEAEYERIGEHNLVGEDEGDVQSEVEARLLAKMLQEVKAIESGAGQDAILVVENESGVDYPRLHSTQRTIVVGFENRLYFTFKVDPPLRISVYRRKQA